MTTCLGVLASVPSTFRLDEPGGIDRVAGTATSEGSSVSTIAVASSSLLFGHGSGYGFSHAPFLGFPQRGIGRHTLARL